jgi:hypothetical protein
MTEHRPRPGRGHRTGNPQSLHESPTATIDQIHGIVSFKVFIIIVPVDGPYLGNQVQRTRISGHGVLTTD